MSTPKKLKGKQTSFLRGLGHHLEPVTMIGKEGMTDNLIKSVAALLDARELIKGKVQENCPLDRHEAAELLAERTKSSLVQVIGRTFLLYRENKKQKEDKKIILPR